VVSQCYQRHRHQEFLKFLRRLDEEFPGSVPPHLVMDNYGTHKKQEVRSWLKKHPRFVLHFVPASSSCLNLVERWFGELSRECIRRGAFFSVVDLEKAIAEYLDAWNEDPKAFVWTATVARSWKSCLAAGKRWRRFNPDAPCHAAERRPTRLSSYFADATLAHLARRGLPPFHFLFVSHHSR